MRCAEEGVPQVCGYGGAEEDQHDGEERCG